MKDVLRRENILQQEVVDILNRQIKLEAQSSAGYLAMAAWCDRRGYDNSAQYFFNQSDGEREHQLRFFHYLVDMECEAISPAINQPDEEFSTLRSVFERALDMEATVTDAIHDVVRACRKVGDLATEEFMREFVKEQIEEEFVARRTLELFDTLGEDKIALGMFEERVLHVKYDDGSGSEG